MYKYYMFNKPAGYLTAKEDKFKPTIMEFFPEELRKSIHPVGRLDYDTHGLLLLTDDGRLDPAILMPEHHVTKKYEFYAIGNVDEEKKKRLESGVIIGESGVMSKPCRFSLDHVYTVKEIEEYLPEFRRNRYLKNPNGPAFYGSLWIHEGRKHQVKLMMRAIDCRITRLYRTEIAGIKLDPQLCEGQYRELNSDEISILKEYIDADEEAKRINLHRDN